MNGCERTKIGQGGEKSEFSFKSVINFIGRILTTDLPKRPLIEEFDTRYGGEVSYEEKDGKYRLKIAERDEKGEIIKDEAGNPIFKKLDTEYENIRPLNYNVILVKQGGLRGAVNKSGEEIIEIKYDNIDCLNCRTEFIRLKEGSNVGLLKYENNEINKIVGTEAGYNNIELLYNERMLNDRGSQYKRFIVTKGNEKGLIDDRGNIILQPTECDSIKLLSTKSGDSGKGTVVIKKGNRYEYRSTKDGKKLGEGGYLDYQRRRIKSVLENH